MYRQAMYLVFIFLLAGLVGACRQTGTTPGAAAPTAEAPVAGGNVAESTPEAPVPQIASGTMPAIQSPPTPTPLPTGIGERHVVTLEQALAAATFPLYEPKDLPEKTYRDVVQLEQPREGESAPGLPLVRFVYTVEPSGAFFITQRPADGSPGQGEPVDIAGISGWLTETETAVIVEWELGQTRIQVRGNGLDRDTVLAAARSMTPIEQQ